MRIEMSITEIDDTPGYQWEVSWNDRDGERWSEECEDTADLLERIQSILDDPP